MYGQCPILLEAQHSPIKIHVPCRGVVQVRGYSLGNFQGDLTVTLSVTCQTPGIDCNSLLCTAGAATITNPTPGQIPPAAQLPDLNPDQFPDIPPGLLCSPSRPCGSGGCCDSEDFCRPGILDNVRPDALWPDHLDGQAIVLKAISPPPPFPPFELQAYPTMVLVFPPFFAPTHGWPQYCGLAGTCVDCSAMGQICQGANGCVFRVSSRGR